MGNILLRWSGDGAIPPQTVNRRPVLKEHNPTHNISTDLAGHIDKDDIIIPGSNQIRDSNVLGETEVERLLLPLLKPLKINGLFWGKPIHGINSRLNHVCRLLLFVGLILIYIEEAVRHTSCTLVSGKDFRSITLLWSIAVYKICLVLWLMIARFTIQRGFPAFSHQLQRVQLVGKKLKELKQFERRIRIALIVVLGQFLWDVIAYVGVVFAPPALQLEELRDCTFFPVSSRSTWRIFATIFTILVSSVSYTALMFQAAFFWACCRFITIGFVWLEAHIRDTADKSSSTDVTDELSNIIIQHQSLRKAVAHVNSMFSAIICVFFAMAVPLTTIILYLASRDRLLPDTFLLLCVYVVVVLIAVAIVSLPTIPVYEQACKAHCEVQHISPEHLTDKGQRLLLLCRSQCSTDDIGISVSGVFLMRKGTILAIIGTVITYGLVIFQIETEAIKCLEQYYEDICRLCNSTC